jgi:hypothetical protein
MREKLLPPIHSDEILREEFMKRWACLPMRSINALAYSMSAFMRVLLSARYSIWREAKCPTDIGTEGCS